MLCLRRCCGLGTFLVVFGLGNGPHPSSVPFFSTLPTRVSVTAPIIGPPLPVGHSVGPHLVNNRLVDAAGRPLVLRGAARWSLEFSCAGDGHFAPTDFAAMRAWGLNSVRIPLNSWYWLWGDTPVPADGSTSPIPPPANGCTAAAYQATVARAVHDAEGAGLYVLLVDQWSHPNCGCAANEGNPRLAYPWDATFWSQVAARYAADPQVGFVPITEPHDISPTEWAEGWNGGPGMRALAMIISAAAPGHLILLSGRDWASNLDVLTDGHAVTGPNIGYELHIYQHWNPLVVAGLLQRFYITAGEFGINDATSPIPHDYTPSVLATFAAAGTGYFAWAWATRPAGDANPLLFVNDWTHLSGYGQGYRAFLHDQGCGVTRNDGCVSSSGP